MQRRPRPEQPVSLCFGGGGFLAMAFGLGVADGLAAAGLPVAAAPMLGTSGGSWAAALAATGVPLDRAVHVCATGRQRGRTHPELTREVFGERRDPRVSVSVVELTSGRPRILRGSEHRLADLVGASSAAPGLFPPYRVGTRRYLDGGLYTPTAAHAAAPAQLLVVAAPMARPVLGPPGAWFDRLLAAETRLWRRRTGGDVLCIRPDREFTARVGRGLRSLLDPDRTPAVYDAARDLALARIADHATHVRATGGAPVTAAA